MRITAFMVLWLAIAAAAAGCRLDPLVDDAPGASAYLLPSGAVVPSVVDNDNLANQIALNDGLDDATAGAAIIVPLQTGASAGAAVRFWAFGAATFAPSPLYQFFAEDGTPIDHPGLVDALPGDPGYSPVHALVHVVVTAAYDGQRITSSQALSDAIELGLVQEPAPSTSLVASPIVLPSTQLEVGATMPAEPVKVYARGYRVGAFFLGGALGVQPGKFFVPTSNVSFLREATGVGYDDNRPIFQATIPAAPPTDRANYTALSTVIHVDLADAIHAADIKSDADLFTRDARGAITGVVARNVKNFQVTGESLLLPLQFAEGQP